MPSASMATRRWPAQAGSTGNNEPGPEAKAEETDRQHDDDRFEQCLGKLADRLAHHLGLVRHQVELDPDGEALLQAFGRFMQAFAELEIVAALAHVDPDADRRLAVDAEHFGRRVAVTTLDLGDVGQLVEVTVDRQIEVGHVLR